MTLDWGCSYLDQELRDPHLTRGMTRIWNDVQSNLGPHFLQCPCSRRLMVGGKASQTVSGEIFQKGTGQLGTYGAYNIISSLHDYCRYMATAKRVQALSIAHGRV